jgi:hypothetical protein
MSRSASLRGGSLTRVEQPEGKAPVELNVNGTTPVVVLEPRVSLLDPLRELVRPAARAQ